MPLVYSAILAARVTFPATFAAPARLLAMNHTPMQLAPCSAIPADSMSWSTYAYTIMSVTHAGINPTLKQSGEFNSIHNHMSKRGSPYLMYAIFMSAATCAFHDSPPNAYYKKKRDQGKHQLTATGAVARKLTTAIYAVLRDCGFI